MDHRYHLCGFDHQRPDHGSEEIKRLSKKVKAILVVELNAGQMIEDVRLSLEDRLPVHHYGRMGGIVMDPSEVLDALKKIIEK